MASPGDLPALVAPIGAVNVGGLVWRNPSGLQLTVVVKARFALRHNDTMALVEPPPLERRDRHIDDDPTRSLQAASDWVPYRRRADVWLTGHAHAPAARTVAVSVVRLGLYRGGIPLLDKTLHVYGERARSDDPPAPFERMPIVYERAFGGIGFDDNPVGVGADERRLVPNIIDPRAPERPGGFGPISRYWKLRRRRLSQAARKQLERPIAEVPHGFDWSYFQAAPEDQRVPFLHGDEWLVLDGMSRTLVRLQSRLPKVTALARVLPLVPSDDDPGDLVAMVADTLAIDADHAECCVCWRGAVPVVSVESLRNVMVAGAIVGEGESVDWTQAYRRAARRVPRREPSLPSLSLDRSGITAVSEVGAPEGVFDELSQTRVDPPFDSSLARVEPPERSATRGLAVPRYPRSGDSEEVTDTNVGGPPMAELSVIEPSRSSLAVDTEPGQPPTALREEDLPWLLESPHEPGVESGDDDPDTERPADSDPGSVSADSWSDGATDSRADSAASTPRPTLRDVTDGGPHSDTHSDTRSGGDSGTQSGDSDTRSGGDSGTHSGDSDPHSGGDSAASTPRPTLRDATRSGSHLSGSGASGSGASGSGASGSGSAGSRPRLTSLPPALDSNEFATTLRDAGASEEDIAAVVESLESVPSSATPTEPGDGAR